MINEFKKSISDIKNYNDIMKVLLLYYFDQDTFIWYKHLIDNKMAYTKQSQIGIMYNLSQTKISYKLKRIKKFIAKCTQDLDLYRNEILNILTYAQDKATKVQQETIVLFMQHKSYSNIGKKLGVSRQSVCCTIHQFLRSLQKRKEYVDVYNSFIKLFFPKYNLTK